MNKHNLNKPKSPNVVEEQRNVVQTKVSGKLGELDSDATTAAEESTKNTILPQNNTTQVLTNESLNRFEQPINIVDLGFVGVTDIVKKKMMESIKESAEKFFKKNREIKTSQPEKIFNTYWKNIEKALGDFQALVGNRDQKNTEAINFQFFKALRNLLWTENPAGNITARSGIIGFLNERQYEYCNPIKNQLNLDNFIISIKNAYSTGILQNPDIALQAFGTCAYYFDQVTIGLIDREGYRQFEEVYNQHSPVACTAIPIWFGEISTLSAEIHANLDKKDQPVENMWQAVEGKNNALIHQLFLIQSFLLKVGQDKSYQTKLDEIVDSYLAKIQEKALCLEQTNTRKIACELLLEFSKNVSRRILQNSRKLSEFGKEIKNKVDSSKAYDHQFLIKNSAFSNSLMNLKSFIAQNQQELAHFDAADTKLSDSLCLDQSKRLSSNNIQYQVASDSQDKMPKGELSSAAIGAVSGSSSAFVASSSKKIDLSWVNQADSQTRDAKKLKDVKQKQRQQAKQEKEAARQERERQAARRTEEKQQMAKEAQEKPQRAIEEKQAVPNLNLMTLGSNQVNEEKLLQRATTTAGQFIEALRSCEGPSDMFLAVSQASCGDAVAPLQVHQENKQLKKALEQARRENEQLKQAHLQEVQKIKQEAHKLRIDAFTEAYEEGYKAHYSSTVFTTSSPDTVRKRSISDTVVFFSSPASNLISIRSLIEAKAQSFKDAKTKECNHTQPALS